MLLQLLFGRISLQSKVHSYRHATSDPADQQEIRVVALFLSRVDLDDGQTRINGDGDRHFRLRERKLKVRVKKQEWMKNGNNVFT
jgi:hypothetical protein